MEIISSKENNSIKLYRSLATSAKERAEQGLVVLEGLRLCCEAATAGAEITHLLATAAALENPQLGELVKAAKTTISITPILSEYISQTKHGQDIYCICKMPTYALPDLTLGGCFLLLERLQDPGNLGTIIRCAEAFGMTAVLLSEDCADHWSPKVMRSAMGSCFRQPVVICRDLVEAIGQLRQAGVEVYASTLNKSAVPPLEMLKGSGGIGVVVGNEGNGLSQEAIDACDLSVYIPMTPHIESLNAATAATVLMWELFGRGTKKGG